MVNLSDILKEGYQSLASRALDNFCSIQPFFYFKTREIPKEYVLYEDSLERMKKTGTIDELAGEGICSLYRIESTIDAKIPEEYTLQEAESCLGIAIDCIMNYYGYSNLKELKEVMDIEEITLSPSKSCFLQLIDSNFHSKNTFVARFDPKKPITSFIDNINALSYPLSPEYRELRSTVDNLSSIESYRKLLKLIDSDSMLSLLYKEPIYSGQVRFLKKPEIINKAKESNLDLKAIDDFLETRGEWMNYLICLAAGESLVVGSDIIASSEFMQENPFIDFYKQAALMAALQAPLRKKGKNLNLVGIGLAEYFRKYVGNETLADSGLLKEISSKYFSVNEH